MTKDYNGAKYFGPNDLSTHMQLDYVKNVVETTDLASKVSSVNKVIELYNIIEFYDNEKALLIAWNNQVYNRIGEARSSYYKIVSEFFKSLDDDNIDSVIGDLWEIYAGDFWKLVSKFSISAKSANQRISASKLLSILNAEDQMLCYILRNIKLVKAYDEALADFIRTSYLGIELVIQKLFTKDGEVINLPSKLLKSEYETLFQKYIGWEKANLKYLEMIANTPSHVCTVSDETKLSARRAYETAYENIEKHYMHAHIEVEYGSIPHPKQLEYQDDGTFKITYNIEWLESSLNYPLILFNCWVLFEMFDQYWRSNFPAVISERGVMENAIRSNERYVYPESFAFNIKNVTHTNILKFYYDFLEQHKINLEDVIKWFYQDFLADEFDIKGFVFFPSSEGTTWLEKCRNLSSEIDGILKQFNVLVSHGVIDRQLIETSSPSVHIREVGSFITDKYAYINDSNEEIKNEIGLLFSTQYPLSYTQKTKSKYQTLKQLLQNVRDMKRDDFSPFQNSIDWLINKGDIIVGDKGCLMLNEDRISILSELYQHEVICLHYCTDTGRNIVESMHDNKDLEFGSTLLSKPECRYMAYMFNKEDQNANANSRELRNRYIHCAYPLDVQTQQSDYIELLKIALMVTGKIYEECLIRKGIGAVNGNGQ